MLRFLPGWQQLCGSKLRRNLKPRFRVDSRRRHPALELLEERAMLSVAQDIQNAIAPYQAALNTALDTATSLPLVGKQFKDLQELDTLLTNALDKIAAQTQNITSGHFQLAIPLTTISHTFTFNLGLDAFMQVSTSGGVTASVTPVLNVGFNYDGTTATLDKANTNIDIGFGLSLPDFQATMSFNGLLYTHAVDMGTNFQGHLAFGFNTGDNGVSAHFSGDAHIRLGLTMSFVDPALHASYNPIFKTNFELDWGFNPQSNVLAAPHIALKNFSIDVDSFMHGFLGDIVTTVQKYTKPLQPFIDMFNTPVPIISAFDSSETMGDLLLKGASLTEDQQDRFKLMVKIITVLNTFDLSGSTGGATLNFGDINIGVTDITNASGFNIDTSQLTGVIDDIFNSPALQDVQDTLESVANYTGLTSSAGFKFQVLENPGDVIGGILTGQTKTMFSYDTGREHFDAAASVGVGIPDVIGLFLQAGITFDAQLSMGYDTAGLTKFAREDPQHKPEDLLHGFYFDNSIDTSGPPIPNVSSPRKTALYLQGFAGVKATLLLANVTGGIHANLSVELASADSSSHVHLDDMIQNLASHAKVFKISGQVYAAATIDISLDTVVGPDITFFSYELAKDVLIDFDPPPAPTFSVPLVVIDVTGQHTLTLDPSKMPPGSSVTVQPFHDFTITSAGTFVGDGIRVDYASEIDLYVERKDDTNTNYYNLVGVNGAVPDGVSITVIDPFRVFADEGAVSPAPGQTRPGVVLAGGKNVHYKYVGAADGSLAHVLLAGGYGSSTLAGGTMEFGNFIPAARLDQAKQHFGDMSGFDAAGVALINSRIDGDVAPASPAGIIGSTMSASRGGLMLGGPGANSFIATGAGSYEMIGGPWVDTFSISPSFAGVPATYAIDAGGGDSDSLVVRVPAGENVTFENATVADRYTPSFKALAVQANAGLSATAHGVRKVRIIATSGSTVTLGDTSELNVDFSITGGGHIIFGGTNAPDVFNVSTSGSYYDRKNHFTVQKYGFDEDGVLHYPGNYGIILPSRMADPIYSITRTFGTNGRTQTIPFAVADNFGSAIELNAGGASDAYSITMGVAAFVDVTVNDTDTSTQNAVTVNVRDSNLVNNIVTLTDNALLLDYYTAVVFHDLIHVGTVNQGGYVSSFASSVHYQTSVHFNGNNNITFASGAAFLQTNVNRSAAAVAASIVIDNQSYRSFIPFESFGAVSGLVFDGTLPIPYFVTLPATHSLDVQANAGNLTIQKNAPSAPPETFNVYENTGTLSIQVSRNWNVDFDTFNVISNAGSVTIDNRINASIGGSSFITGLNSVTNVAANFGVINVQDTLAAGLINIALDSQVNIGNGSLRDVHGTINLSNSNGHFGLNLDDRTNTGAGRLWTVSSQQTTIGDLTVNYPKEFGYSGE